jgi:predicted RNase H-like HicB family nuclease
MGLTAIIEHASDGWYVGQIEEIPEAMSQGRTLEELRQNLEDALQEVLDSNKASTEEAYRGKEVIREKIDWPHEAS